MLLPKAGSRGLVAGVLGAFLRLYFFLFVQTHRYGPGSCLAGRLWRRRRRWRLLAVLCCWRERVGVPRAAAR